MEIAVRHAPSVAVARCALGGWEGEGSVSDVRGPGDVMVQSGNPGAVIDRLTTVPAFSRS